jgi:hypothetical protein
MSMEVPAIMQDQVNLDYVVCNLSDPRMAKCLDDRIQSLQQTINEICRKRNWTLQWLQSRDPETLDDEARIVIEAQALIEYLEYLRRGSAY